MPKPLFRVKRYAHPKYKFLVRGKVQGKWKRRYFLTEREAINFAQQQNASAQKKNGAVSPSPSVGSARSAMPGRAAQPLSDTDFTKVVTPTYLGPRIQRYLGDSWSMHLPFAYELMREVAPKVFVELGVKEGESYFTFCQSAAENNVNVRCYGVDSWRGDLQTGELNPDIQREVAEYNWQYSSFSELKPMLFAEALDDFADGTIDLLHIDGSHIYEDVKTDFTTWLPKLTPNGIVLFHDVILRDRGFGVWKLWDEIAREDNSFLFEFGYGLGVWKNQATAKTDSPFIRQFLGASQTERRALNSFYANSGAALALWQRVQKQAAAESEAARFKAENEERTKQVFHFQREAEEKSKHGALLQRELDERTRQVSHFQREADEKSKHAAQLQRELEERTRQVTHFQQESEEQSKHATQLQRELEKRTEQVTHFQHEAEDQSKHSAQLQRELEERTKQVAHFQREAEDQSKQAARLQRELEKRTEQVTHFQREAEDQSKHAAQLGRELEERTKQVTVFQREAEEKTKHATQLQRDLEERTKQVLHFQRDAQEQAKHIGILQQDNEERKKQVVHFQAEAAEKAHRVAELKLESEEQQRQLVALRQEVEEKSSLLAGAQSENKITSKRLLVLQRRSELKTQRVTELKEQLRRQSRQLGELEGMASELAQLQRTIEEKSEQIVKLQAEKEQAAHNLERLEGQSQHASEQLKRSARELTDARWELLTLRADLVGRIELAEASKEPVLQLQDQLEATGSEREQLRGMNMALLQDLERERSSMAALREELAAAAQEASQKEAHWVDRLAASVHEASQKEAHWTERLAASGQRIQELQGQLALAQEHSRRMQAKADSVKNRFAALLEQFRSTQGLLASTREHLKIAAEDLRTQRAQMSLLRQNVAHRLILPFGKSQRQIQELTREL